MRSLKDAEEEMGNLFVCLSFFSFSSCLIFFQGDPVDQSNQLEESWAGKIREPFRLDLLVRSF
jgi:hypothetical protein